MVQKHENKSQNQIYFVTQYSSQANNVKQIIKRNWDIIQSDALLRGALAEVPTISFRKAPTLRESLAKSYIPPVQNKTWLGTRGGHYTVGVQIVNIAITYNTIYSHLSTVILHL